LTEPGTPPPDWLVEHARRFAAEGRTPAVPRRAATVLLLREAAPGFEVYAIRRAASMAFASGMYAFPGGGVDPRDESADVRWEGPDETWWAAALGLPPAAARAVVCAAVREVFEESGVLLAGEVVERDLEPQRQAVLARDLSLGALLADLGLPLRSDLLAPWSRWITPEVEPRRYDTWFFLARLPAGQDARDVGGEADHTVWLRPDAVGDLPMLPPTRVTFAEVAGYRDIDAAMAAQRDAATPVMPRVELTDDGARLVID
jgi:8-oxo-dGTP pyrophosphatase MutT (NUDIX family)